MIKRSFLILSLFLASLLPANAKGIDPYEVLQLSKQATPAQVQQAFKKIASRPGITDEELMAAYYSYSILKDPVTRNQFDQNQPLSFEVPLSDRKKMEEAIRILSPKEASFLHRTGRATENMVVGAGTFYLALAITTSSKCLETRNPIYCKEFLNEITDMKGEASFAGFIITAHLTSLLKKPLTRFLSVPTSNAVAGLGGLAVGSLTSDVMNDVMNKPEFSALFHLDTIPDENARTARRDELIHKIWIETGGSQDWWISKTPEVASLLTAAVATQKTMGLITRSVMQSKGDLCGIQTANFIRTIVTGEGLTGAKKFFSQKGVKLAQMLMFLGYMKVINPVADGIWNSLTVEKSLKNNRKKMSGEGTSNSTQNSSAAFEISPDLIQENGKLWDAYLKARLKPFNELQLLSEKDLLEYDKEINKVGGFYNWFFSGATNSGTLAQRASWERVKAYLPENVTLEEARKEGDRYLRAFFFGPDFHQAFHEAEDVHGLPVPGRINPKVEPFRVAEKAAPALKNASFETLLNEIRKPQYSMDWLMDPNGNGEGIGGQFRVFVQKNRRKRVETYERELPPEFLEILKGANPGDDQGLGAGILPGLKLELSDLDAAMINAHTKKTKSAIELRRAEVLAQKAEVEKMIDYYSQPIESRTQKHEKNIDKFSKQPSQPNSEMILYLKSFIMPEESKIL